jgi:tetratricopeptide (TPR) repeat protein
MTQPPDNYRFEIALSFAGSHREKVRALAEHLSAVIDPGIDKRGLGRVFFDEWFSHEILGSDMDVLLQRFYHDQSLMVVADLSQDYADRPWTQAEARAIRSLRFKLDAARDETARLRLLCVRFDVGSVPGVSDTEGWLDGVSMSVQQLAKVILDRRDLLLERMAAAAASPVSHENAPPKTNRPKIHAHQIVLLPYPSIGTLFKGREEFLSQLRESLKRHSKATAITGKALHGLGGVGKTRLAVEYAWQHVDDYTAVVFVTADSPENLRRNIAELVGPKVLNLQEQSVTEEQVRVAAAIRWLQHNPGWCLILDNVDDEKTAADVEQLLSRLQGGDVLITSRFGKWSDSVKPLELDVLDEDASANFLLEKTKPKGNRGRLNQTADDEDAKQLAKELGGLALALEQAGSYIVQQRISLVEYLRLWRSKVPSVQDWLDDRMMKYPRSVAVTWQTTIDQLGKPERILLDLLAWFAPEPVPLSVFGDYSLLPSDVDWGKDFRVAIGNLADYSMVRWNIENNSVTAHRVVQEILRSRQSNAVENLKIVLRIIEAAIPKGDPGDVRMWPAWEPIQAHVEFTALVAEAKGIFSPTATLMGQLGTLLSAKALHREAENLKRRALAIDEKEFGEQSTQVALRLSNLAQTLQDTNRLSEAEPLMRRALAIDEQSYDPDDPNVAIDLNNLAQLLQATNRLSEAEPLMRQALAIDEQSYGPDHPAVARDLNNLAQLLQATNRLSEVEPLMARVVSIFEKSLGKNHPIVATALNNLAHLLQATNRLSEAEPLMRQALAIDEQSYGPDHPDVAIDLNNLAQLLQATNRLSEAEPLMARVVSILEKSLGKNHPNVATALNNLALLLQATNRLSEAEPLMRQALAIAIMFQKQTGHEHSSYQGRKRSYNFLLRAMELSDTEIEQRLQSVYDTFV